MELIMGFLTLLAVLCLAYTVFVTLSGIDIYRKTKKSQKPVPPVSAILTMLVNENTLWLFLTASSTIFLLWRAFR